MSNPIKAIARYLSDAADTYRNNREFIRKYRGTRSVSLYTILKVSDWSRSRASLRTIGDISISDMFDDDSTTASSSLSRYVISKLTSVCKTIHEMDRGQDDLSFKEIADRIKADPDGRYSDGTDDDKGKMIVVHSYHEPQGGTVLGTMLHDMTMRDYLRESYGPLLMTTRIIRDSTTDTFGSGYMVQIHLFNPNPDFIAGMCRQFNTGSEAPEYFQKLTSTLRSMLVWIKHDLRENGIHFNVSICPGAGTLLLDFLKRQYIKFNSVLYSAYLLARTTILLQKMNKKEE